MRNYSANPVLDLDKVRKDRLSCDELAASLASVLAWTGVYHGDKHHRLFAPRHTSLPWPTRLDFDLMRVPDGEQGIDALTDEAMETISALFASFLRKNIGSNSVQKLLAASANGSALVRRLQDEPHLFCSGNSRNRSIVAVDAAIRSGSAALSLLSDPSLPRPSHYVTLIDFDHGGDQIVCQRHTGVTLLSMMQRRDLYLHHSEGKSGRIDDAHVGLLHRYRVNPGHVRAAIDDVFDHCDALHSLFVPYRDVPASETANCVLMRLALEIALLQSRSGQSRAELSQEREMCYYKLDQAALGYHRETDNGWWPAFVCKVRESDPVCTNAPLTDHQLCRQGFIYTREPQLRQFYDVLKEGGLVTPYKLF